MSSTEQDRDHPVMWDWTDEGGGGNNNNHESIASLTAALSSPQWAYPNDDTDFPNDCDCSDLPPPPKFALPPPPVPFGGGAGANQIDDCHSSSDGARQHREFDGFSTAGGSRILSDLEYCDMRVIEGPYTRTAIPSLIVIIGCSFVMLVMVLVAFLLFRKHKRKMQNFLPCKASPGNHCDLTSGNSVLYEDLTNIRPRNLTNHCTPNQTVAPMEHPEDNTLLDVKCSNYGGAGFTSVGNTTFIYPPTAADDNFILKNNCNKSKDHFNQAYEEVSAGSSDGKRAARDSDLGSEVDDDDEEEVESDERLDVDTNMRNKNNNRTNRSSMSSEGELAEDELSLVDFPKKSYTADGRSPGSRSGDSSLRGSTGDDLCRDFDSVYSEDNETTTKSTAGSKDTFQGQPNEDILPYDGPSSSSSGERRRRRKRGYRGAAPPPPSRRVTHIPAYPVYSEILETNGADDDNHHHGVTLPSSRSDLGVDQKGPRSGRNRNGNGIGTLPWRTSNGDVYDGYRDGIDAVNPEMVLMIPAQRRDLPRQPTGLGGGDIGLKSQVGGRNNQIGEDHKHNKGRTPSSQSGEYSTQQQPIWGPDYPPSSHVNQSRNSDPHERALAEFSTFQPKRGSSSTMAMPSRDLYGLDAGLLNDDVGVMNSSDRPYAHLPTVAGSHRHSGSEGSRSSTSSGERLLPVNDGSYYPYHHHHQMPPSHSFRQNHNHHHQQQSPAPSSLNSNRHHHHQQPHYLPEVLPGSPSVLAQRVAPYQSNQRSNNRRKNGNKSTAADYNTADTDLDAPYGARTVFT